VIGLTTALELRAQHPESTITLLAKYLPGDSSIEYASPWAGANWLSVATDNGRQEKWDEVAYKKFGQLADSAVGSDGGLAGVMRMPIRAFFDNEIEEAGVLSQETGKIWYGNLVGGIRWLEESELREGVKFGMELRTFVMDVSKYLPW
jgi:D-amino-acid oxidase